MNNGATDINITLDGDITLSAPTDGQNNWIPITGYTGTFDGNGHTISGLAINADETYTHMGLFSTIKGGKVINLNVKGNVTRKATNSSNAIGTAGVVGFNQGGLVQNCSFEGKIEIQGDDALNCVGGVVGIAYNNAQVIGCFITSNSEVTTKKAYNVGGVIGAIYDGTSAAIGCYNLGATVTTDDDKATCQGGVIGFVQYSKLVVACYNVGGKLVGSKVSLEPNVALRNNAGIVGNVTFGGGITACYFVADEDQQTENFYLIAGGSGLVTITDCYCVADKERYTTLFANQIQGISRCKNMTGEELKDETTINDLNTAIEAWNATNGNKCPYKYEKASSEDDYLVLVINE